MDPVTRAQGDRIIGLLQSIYIASFFLIGLLSFLTGVMIGK